MLANPEQLAAVLIKLAGSEAARDTPPFDREQEP
jgi:hypothetical protein